MADNGLNDISKGYIVNNTPIDAKLGNNTLNLRKYTDNSSYLF